MSAPTVADLASVLGARVGGWIALASIPDALATGLRSLSLYPASADMVVDSDLSLVQGGDMAQLLDVAEWRALETALNNCDEDQLRAIGYMGDVERARSLLLKRVDTLSVRNQRAWQTELPDLELRVIHLNFAEDGCRSLEGGGPDCP